MPEQDPVARLQQNMNVKGRAGHYDQPESEAKLEILAEEGDLDAKATLEMRQDLQAIARGEMSLGIAQLRDHERFVQGVDRVCKNVFGRGLKRET